jgi:hypothetical protein
LTPLRRKRIIPAVRDLRLSTIGAVAALVTVAGFVLGIALMATHGVQVLIPETGSSGAEWAQDVQDAGDWFVAGAWIVGLAGLVGIVALVGFYDALKHAGPVLVLAPIAGAVGLTLVTASHVIPIAIGQELAPSYAENADVFDTLAATCLLLNYFGNVFNWAVATPLYAVAILKTGALPKWLGWIGLVSAAFAGWLGLFAPLSSLIEGLTTIGFFAFFIFLIGMGITILRRRGEPGPEAAPAPVLH